MAPKNLLSKCGAYQGCSHVEKGEQKDKKVIACLEHQLDYQTKSMESTSGTKYIPPEAMSSDEEEVADDLYEEPPFDDEEPPTFDEG